ncbi:MAG: hypothetical protein ACO1NW_03730 [Chitinophagaceae bacterium]
MYQVSWKITKKPAAYLSLSASGEGFSFASDSTNNCADNIENSIAAIINETEEEKVKELVGEVRKMIRHNMDDACNNKIRSAIALTTQKIYSPYSLHDNEEVLLTVKKISSDETEQESWNYTFETPQKSRWLTHYGLTYAPSIISKVSNYYSLADTSTANRYTISKENDNGPKPWENISVTANFTYPFHSDNRGFDGGFTAGFGLSAGFELSGHAGLSMIIGQNIIIGTGVGFMQKHRLKGEYREGQVIKENLSFDALHRKVWMPELNFTIGFRFGSNPFGKKSSSDAESSSSSSDE